MITSSSIRRPGNSGKFDWLILPTPEAKARIKFLEDFGLPLPEKREDGPEIYDFIRGKAPSDLDALFQWLKDKLPPQSYGTVAAFVAGMQRFYPNFVPTIQLESLPNRHWEPEETNEACRYLRAACERGVKFDVRCDPSHLPKALVKELCDVLASPQCLVKKLVLANGMGPFAPDWGMLWAAVAANASLQELEIPLDASPLKEIDKGTFSRSVKRLCINSGGLSDPEPLAHEHLCNILSKGGITSAGITGKFEHPHSYDFAETVAKANLQGGQVETVTIQATFPHCFYSYEGSKQCIPGRRQALRTLLLGSKVIKHLTVPIGWFADITDDDLRKLVQDSWLWSLDVWEGNDDLPRSGELINPDAEPELVEQRVDLAQSLIEQSMEYPRAYGAAVGLFKLWGIPPERFGQVFAETSYGTPDSRSLACVNRSTASFSRQQFGIAASLQVGQRWPFEAPPEPAADTDEKLPVIGGNHAPPKPAEG